MLRGASRLAAVALGALLAAPAPGGAEACFERREVDVGGGGQRTVLTAFLLGGPLADLVVLAPDGRAGRRLRIFSFSPGNDSHGDGSLGDDPIRDGAWAVALDAPLPPEVSFVDVLRGGGRDRLGFDGRDRLGFDGRDRLVAGEAGRLVLLDPAGLAEMADRAAGPPGQDATPDDRAQPGGRAAASPRRALVETALVAVAARLDLPHGGRTPHVDVTHDVNDDGRDDLVVPVADGFRVFVQEADGRFAEPVTVGGPPDLARIAGARGYRYDPWRQSRVHRTDWDGDGRLDLVYWDGARFAVHRQGADGRFAPAAERFATGVAFDSDRRAWLADHLEGRVLDTLTDLDGDGAPDLVIASLAGGDSGRPRSALEVHFGARAVASARSAAGARSAGAGARAPAGVARAAGAEAQAAAAGARAPGVTFRAAPDTIVRTAGRVGFATHWTDLDGDGAADLMRATIASPFLRGTWYRRFRGFMGGEIPIDLEFFRLADAPRDREAPDAVRRIHLQYPGAHRGPGWAPLDLLLRGGAHRRRPAQTHARAFRTPVRLGDVTGDGRADLLLGRDRGEPPGPRRHADDALHVFDGVAGPGLFAAQPRELVTPLPEDREYVWLADLDRDGRQDVVLHHASATGPPRVTLLLARPDCGN